MLLFGLVRSSKDTPVDRLPLGDALTLAPSPTSAKFLPVITRHRRVLCFCKISDRADTTV